MKDSVSDRKGVLRRAQKAYERYLHLLDSYRILSKEDQKLNERFLDNRDEFALIPGNDAAARRDTKVARFKQEKELKMKLEVRQQRTRIQIGKKRGPNMTRNGMDSKLTAGNL